MCMQGSRSTAEWECGWDWCAPGWSELTVTLFCLSITGLACLHISTLKGNIPMMSLLLESGANIDVRVRLGTV